MLADITGFTGVAILLLAFVLQLSRKITIGSLLYLSLNFSGALLACIASILINYIPFIILEGTWTLVALIALIMQLSKIKHK